MKDTEKKILKFSYLVEAIKEELRNDFVSKAEFDDLKKKCDKLENKIAAGWKENSEITPIKMESTKLADTIISDQSTGKLEKEQMLNLVI